jgi:hypothetical protein
MREKTVILIMFFIILGFFLLAGKSADNTQTSYEMYKQSDEIVVADYCTKIINKY